MRPRVRRLFRHLTVLWALLGLGKAMLTLWLLQSQSLETFVLVKSVTVLVVNLTAAAATIALAAWVARQEGLLGPPGGTLTGWASARTRSASASDCSPSPR